jgi:hypothetical protein
MEKDDKLVSVKPMLERIADWEVYLSNIDIGGNTNMIEQHTRTRRLSRSGMPASFNNATNARQERGVVVASLITTGHPAAKAMRLSQGTPDRFRLVHWDLADYALIIWPQHFQTVVVFTVGMFFP